MFVLIYLTFCIYLEKIKSWCLTTACIRDEQYLLLENFYASCVKPMHATYIDRELVSLMTRSSYKPNFIGGLTYWI